VPTSEPNQAVFQTPFALSLMICDSVITDANSGKQSIIGCFGSLGAQDFPAIHANMTVFAELTDGKGQVPLTLRLIDADDTTELFKGDAVLNMEDPLEVSMLVLTLQGMVFPAPGEYRLQLTAGDSPLMERRLMLIQVETGETRDQETDS
jgi:Family of unknown function (DUF6941)